GGSGICDREYGCSYSGTIAFRTPSTPLPMESDPRKLFQRLFGQGENTQERRIIAKQNASLLDLISKEAADLKLNLGPSDRTMLSDYLESVDEIQRRVEKMEKRDLSKLNLPNAPAGAVSSFEEHINLMFDIIGLAFQANLTRVFTFMMAAEV